VRILVTNDDGVDAPGIHALARALIDVGHDVTIFGPRDDRSGSSAAIGLSLQGRPRVFRVEIDELPGVEAYAVDGPPALAVLIACLGGLGERPELVASGINPGPNTGRAVIHSGTVGAALTAANQGISGMAVSMGTGEPSHRESAATVAVAAVSWVAEQPAGTVLNINVPNAPVGRLRGVCQARLAPFGTVRASMGESEEGHLEVELEGTGASLDPDTDVALVRAGYVAVTSIVGVTAVEAGGAPQQIASHLPIGDAPRPSS
jgi:5'/3'-nucleotidase